MKHQNLLHYRQSQCKMYAVCGEKGRRRKGPSLARGPISSYLEEDEVTHLNDCAILTPTTIKWHGITVENIYCERIIGFIFCRKYTHSLFVMNFS